MPSTYTDNGLQKPGLGEQSGTWGTTANTNYDIVDIMAHGVVTVTLAGTTGTLTTSDGTVSDGAHKVIIFGGAPSGTNTVTVTPNDATHVYVAINNSGEDVVLTQGSGSNVTIPDGNSAIVYCDGAGTGANVVDITAQFGFIPLTAIGSTVQAYDADLVTLGGLAKTDGNFIVGNGTTWVAESGQTVLTSIGVTSTIAELNILDGATVSASELNVLDGIGSLSGNEGKAVVVNPGGTALTYQAFPEGTVYTAGAGLTLTNNSIFSHEDTSTASGIDTSGAQVIDVLSLDTYGHVTALSTRLITAADVGASSITSVSAGSGLTGGGSTGALTLSHYTPSTASTATLSGATVVASVSTDSFGHLTGVTTRSMTAADIGAGDITAVSAGAGLAGGGTSGSVTLSHADTSSQSSVNNSGTTVIQDVTLDTYGHVTGLASVSLSFPSVGVGQSWAVTTIVAGTSYQNTTSSPIMITVTWSQGSLGDAEVSTNNSTWVEIIGAFSSEPNTACFIVPVNHYYRIESGGGAVVQAARLS